MLYCPGSAQELLSTLGVNRSVPRFQKLSDARTAFVFARERFLIFKHVSSWLWPFDIFIVLILLTLSTQLCDARVNSFCYRGIRLRSPVIDRGWLHFSSMDSTVCGCEELVLIVENKIERMFTFQCTMAWKYTRYWPSLFGEDGWILTRQVLFIFCVFYGRDEEKKKNLANIQPSWPNKLGQ